MLNTVCYKKGRPCEMNLSRHQMFSALSEKDSLLWVDFENPNEFESDALVEIFNFHPLAIEDCITDLSQPKVDDYEEYLFLVVHALKLKEHSELATVELDIFLGKNCVVTFHREPLKSIEQIRETVQKKPEVLMGHGSDMLVHAILDHLVDQYQPVLDEYDAKLDLLQEEIFNNPPKDYLSTVMQMKRDIFHLRRTIAPQRDTLNFLTRNPSVFIKPRHMIYFRDVFDHLFRIYGIVEGFQEAVSGILQVYFSHSSHKLNETIQRMTVLATLTMPAVIIGSIYGMNFRYMPELEWRWGYPFSIALMMFVSVMVLIWMKLKKWI